MKRFKILGLVLIVAVLATMALLGGCYPTDTAKAEALPPAPST